MKALKDIFAIVKMSRLGYDLPALLNDRVNPAFRKGFIFRTLGIRFSPK